MKDSEIMKRFKDCHAIRIFGKGFTPGIFVNCNGKIWSYSKEIGGFFRDDMDFNKLEKHIENMIAEGLTVEVM